MSLALLHPELGARAAELGEQFSAARPFPHLVLDDFFSAEFCRALMAEFPPFERAQSLDPEGLPSGKAVVEDLPSLGGAYARADELFRSRAFTELLGALTGIPKLLYDPDYAGGGTHENRRGADLDPHVDFNYHPRLGWHRRLNLIVYLNPNWDTRWGGALELHTDPWLPPEQNRVERVAPLANRAVLFETSERSWHAVEPIAPPPGVEPSRKSLALYLYTEERPPAEIAPSHQTVFVDRPLPLDGEAPRLSYADARRAAHMLHRRLGRLERLARRELQMARDTVELVDGLLAGGRLEPEEAARLRRIFSREDALLHFLYDREKEWSGDQAALRARRERSPGFGFPLFGPAHLEERPRGVDSDDRWCLAQVRATLTVERAIARLTLHGVIAAELGRPQTLTLTIDGRAHERTFGAGEFHWDVDAPLAAGARVPVELHAAATWQPKRALAGSDDARELSFHLLGLELHPA